MHGPHPINHQSTVAAMFGPGAELRGTLGTPSTPGTVAILVGREVLGTGGTFQEAIAAASKRAAAMHNQTDEEWKDAKWHG